jgi:hypothetical protein
MQFSNQIDGTQNIIEKLGKGKAIPSQAWTGP